MIRVWLSKNNLEVYHSHFVIEVRLYGIRYLCYHWFVTSALIGISFFFLFNASLLLLAWAFFFAGTTATTTTDTNGTGSSNNNIAGFGGSVSSSPAISSSSVQDRTGRNGYSRVIVHTPVLSAEPSSSAPSFSSVPLDTYTSDDDNINNNNNTDVIAGDEDDYAHTVFSDNEEEDENNNSTTMALDGGSTNSSDRAVRRRTNARAYSDNESHMNDTAFSSLAHHRDRDSSSVLLALHASSSTTSEDKQSRETEAVIGTEASDNKTAGSEVDSISSSNSILSGSDMPVGGEMYPALPLPVAAPSASSVTTNAVDDSLTNDSDR